MKFKLLISIVPHDSGELITTSAVEAGAHGGTIVMGRGTASNSIIQLLGFGDTSKDIVFIIVEDSKEDSVRNSIIKATETKKAHFGILFSIDVFSFVKQANTLLSDEKGENEMYSTCKMITAIVNKGYAEDAMAAARKAGAQGGTIIAARGTAKEGDAKFFGMEIVPEKDMLIILVDNEKAEGVLDSIKNLACLAKPGSGIAFESPAQNFTFLGSNK